MTSMIASAGSAEIERSLGERAVISGSFRRNGAQLASDREALLDAGCVVLSPLDVAFVLEDNGFVKAAHEVDRTAAEIEADHLRAIEEADFVWLHAPEGYVGPSASMEIGFARALGVPIYARYLPSDVALRSLVTA